MAHLASEELARQSFAARRYEEALGRLASLREHNPEGAGETNTELRNMEGLCLLRLGQPADAAQCFRAVLEVDAEHVDARINLNAARLGEMKIRLGVGDDLFKQGMFDRALQAYEDMLADAERDAGAAAGEEGKEADAVVNDEVRFQIDNNRGAALMNLGRHQEALESFEHALGMRPDHVEALHNRATALKALGRNEEALEAYDLALSHKEDFGAALCGKAEVLSAMERYDEASEVASRSLTLNPADPRALVDRAFARLKQSRFEEAATDLEDAVHKGDNSDETKRLLSMALSLRGDQLQQQGDHEAASVVYAKALEFGSSSDPNPALLCNHGLAMLQAGRTAEAKDSLKQVLEIDADFFNALSALGVLHMQEKEYAEAANAFERALRVKPGEDEIQYNLGVVQLKLGRHELASTTFRDILTRKPDHEHARNALASVESYMAFAAAEKGGLVKKASRENVLDAERKEAEQRREEKQKTAEEEGKGATAGVAAPDLEEPATPVAILHQNRRASQDVVNELTKDSNTGVIGQMVFDYDQLKAPGPYPDGVNVEHREKHLSDAQFEQIFSMTTEEFEALPKWRKNTLKKEHGLF